MTLLRCSHLVDDFGRNELRDIMQHWFWLGLSVAAVGWYLAVTVYVAFRGAKDIKQMFRRLEEQSRS